MFQRGSDQAGQRKRAATREESPPLDRVDDGLLEVGRGGKIMSFDATEALKVPGVEKVVQIDPTPAPAKYAPLAGVAVIAGTTYAALKGRDALKVVWDDGPNKAYDSAAYKAMLEEANRKPGKIERNEGDIGKALAQDPRVHQQRVRVKAAGRLEMLPPPRPLRRSVPQKRRPPATTMVWH